TVPKVVLGGYRTAVLDIDCDGADEVIFHTVGATPDRRWDVSAARSVTSSAFDYGDGSYRLITGSLDGDSRNGRPCEDVILHAPGPAEDVIVYGGLTPARRTAAVGGTYEALTADLNGDGADEVVWYAPGQAVDAIW